MKYFILMHTIEQALDFRKFHLQNPFSQQAIQSNPMQPQQCPQPQGICLKQTISYDLQKNDQQKLPLLRYNKLGHIFLNGVQRSIKKHEKLIFDHKITNCTKNKQKFVHNQSIAALNKVLHCQAYRGEWKRSKTIGKRQKNSRKNQQFYIDQVKKVPFLKVLNYDAQISVLHNLSLIQPSKIIIKNNEEAMSQIQDVFQAFYIDKMCLVKGFKTDKTKVPILQHPNIIPVYGKFKIRLQYYLIMSFSGQSIQGKLQDFGCFTQKLIRKYIHQLITVCEFIIKSEVQLKMINLSKIYLSSSGDCLIDLFECTKDIPYKKNISKQTLYYLSPQYLINKQNSQKSVVWSIGCIILSMIFGRTLNRQILSHPYNRKPEKLTTCQNILWKKVNKLVQTNCPLKVTFKKQIKKVEEQKNIQYMEISDQLYDLIDSCLKLNHKERPNLQQLAKHSFFVE